MTTRTILAAVAALVAAAMATTALAASTAKDPKTLVLQKSDFPAGAVVGQKGADKTPQSSHYYVTYRYRAGSKRVELVSTASVMRVALAKRTFREARQLLQAYRKIRLPKYGDEWVAGVDDSGPAVTGDLWVRTGGTVWAISVGATADSNYLTGREAIEQLNLYGRKAQKRVGRG